MADQTTMRRLAAIRRLARQMPLETADKRLSQIAEVASGKGDVDGVFKENVQNNLAERLEAGMASRSPITGGKPAKPEPEPEKPEPEPEKKRKKESGYDRIMRGGHDRKE
jgi:hypothetical protein